MKKYILLILFTLSYIDANDSIKVDIKASCSDTRNIVEFLSFKDSSARKELTIKIPSDKLYLSKDAVLDNVDGYVDIPDDYYYINTKDKTYKVHGIVDNDNSDKINQFISYVSDFTKFISTDELKDIKSNKDLQFTQKINLESYNREEKSKDIYLTNSLDIYFDTDSFDNEYKKCEEQINSSKNKTYTQAIVLLIILLTTLLVLFKRFK